MDCMPISSSTHICWSFSSPLIRLRLFRTDAELWKNEVFLSPCFNQLIRALYSQYISSFSASIFKPIRTFISSKRSSSVGSNLVKTPNHSSRNLFHLVLARLNERFHSINFEPNLASLVGKGSELETQKIMNYILTFFFQTPINIKSELANMSTNLLLTLSSSRNQQSTVV